MQRNLQMEERILENEDITAKCSLIRIDSDDDYSSIYLHLREETAKTPILLRFNDNPSGRKCMIALRQWAWRNKVSEQYSFVSIEPTTWVALRHFDDPDWLDSK